MNKYAFVQLFLDSHSRHFVTWKCSLRGTLFWSSTQPIQCCSWTPVLDREGYLEG